MTVPLQVRTEPPKPEDIRAQYGYVAMIAQQIPEVGALMEQAVRENWTSERFSLALANTGWWKNTGQGEREWLVQSIADPRTAQREAEAGVWEIKRIAAEIGMPSKWTDDDLNHIYIRSKIEQVSPQAMTGWLFSQMTRGVSNATAETSGGRYGQLINEMYESAFNYGYTSKNLQHEIISAANTIMLGGGAAAPEAFKSKMIQYATSKYAAFADRLRGGETVLDIARPYLETYAGTLELNQQDIDLNDKLLQKALQGDGKIAAPVWQFEQELRKDDRYGYTEGARKSAAQTLTAIGKSFGMIG